MSSMELCGDCKYYCVFNGKGRCKAKIAHNMLRPTTNMCCLNWRAKNGEDNATRKEAHS